MIIGVSLFCSARQTRLESAHLFNVGDFAWNLVGFLCSFGKDKSYILIEK